MGVDLVMKSSLVRKTLDNITVLLVAFENFDNYINKRNKEYELVKKDNLKTEISQPKKFRFGVNSLYSSASRIETDNFNCFNVEKIFNKTSNNKEMEKGNKFNLNKNKNTITNFQKNNENYMGFNIKPYSEENYGTQRTNRLNFEKMKNENINNNKLPPVLNTESNFRQSEDKRNNLFKNIFNANDENMKYLNKIGMNEYMNRTNKIPIKLNSFENKKFSNQEEDDISEDSNTISFDNIENVCESSDFKSKYNHEKTFKNFEEDNKITANTNHQTEI